mmetsp:Transcript_29729/g.54493  ORF Transcript_29729/g.54493 Transcript_29729/m.54493 type:complete len:227 (-) Transcript_29729:268-948(-)
MSHVNPFGGGPLGALDDGARAVEGSTLQLSGRLNGVKENGGSFTGLDCDNVTSTLTETLVDLAVGEREIWEGRLPAFLSISQVHQDGSVAVATVVRTLFMEKVIPVRLVFLTNMVAQDLEALAISSGDQGPTSNSLLNLVDDRILITLQESAVTCTDIADVGVALVCYHTGSRQAGSTNIDDMVSFLCRQKVFIVENASFGVKNLHLREAVCFRVCVNFFTIPAWQ